MQKLSEEILAAWRTHLMIGGIMTIEAEQLNRWIRDAQELEDRVTELEQHLQITEDQLEENG